MDCKHTPRIIPTPISQRRRRRSTNAPKIPNKQCLTDCQSVDYMKKREKEGKELRIKSKKE